MRTCYKCRKDKKEAEFHKNKSMSGGIAYMCKSCRKRYETQERDKKQWAKYVKGWRGKQGQDFFEKEKIVNRNNKIRRKYNITQDQYEAMSAEQDNVCLICGRTEWGTCKGTIVRLAIDHDHNTGTVRGLLCRRCNTAIGLMEEDIGLLMSMIEYIEIGTGL